MYLVASEQRELLIAGFRPGTGSQKFSSYIRCDDTDEVGVYFVSGEEVGVAVPDDVAVDDGEMLM